jgi:putative phosphoesterase
VTDPVLVGLISDTHGLLRPGVFDVFADVDRILNAGDVENPDILTDLLAIAPTTSVWGNVDGPAVHARTTESAVLRIGELQVAVIHGHQVHPDYERLVARFPDARVIVHGHTHVPRTLSVGGVSIVNPGAAGRAQKGHPPTVALLEVTGARASVRHVEIPAED